MSDLKYNEQTGDYEYVGTDFDSVEPGPTTAVAPRPSVYAPTTYTSPEIKALELQENQSAQRAQEVLDKGFDDRPVWAQTPGQFAGDLVKSVVNPVAAIGTDYVDLGHGLVDVVAQTGSWVTGNGFDANKIFDDSDNPLTRARLEYGRSETQAGQFVNTGARVLAGVLTLPAVGISGIARGLKLLSATPKVGKALKLADRANDLRKLDAAIKAPRAGSRGITTALSKIDKGGEATRLAQADDWLKLTYKDVVNYGPGGSRIATFMRSTERAAKSLTKGQASVRTVGESLAWGAFSAFNMAGEGVPELDETLTDMLAEYNLPHFSFLESDFRDTPLQTKLKQMTEGLMLDSVFSALLDVGRIYRFSRAYKVAPAAEKKLIAEAFNVEADELGLKLFKANEIVEYIDDVRVNRVGPDVGATGPQSAGFNYQLLDVELNRVQSARRQIQLQEEMQSQLLERQRQRVQRESALATASDLGEDMPVYPVNVEVMRPPEPTVTPQTLRTGFQQFVRERFADEGFVQELFSKTKQLMPRNRVDAIDYFSAFPAQYNATGTMVAADSVAGNYLVRRGLQEGWITVGPDLLLMYNRKMAFDLDRGQFVLKQASAVDEAAEIARYNDAMGGVDPATAPVRNELDRMEVRDQFDESAIGRSTLGESADPDQALVEAKRQEKLAATQEAGAAAAEDEQIKIDAIAAYGDIGSDRQVVAEMLNQDLDTLPELRVEKIGNRQYQVVNELGESIDGRNYSTLKSAKKGVEIAQKEQAKATIAKARALAARSADQPLPAAFGSNITDSALVRGTVKLTKRQGEVLAELGYKLEASDLNLTQGELSGMATSINQLMEGANPNQTRVLKNILKRIDQQVTELTPAARMAMEVEKSSDLAQKFLKDGEICS